MSAERPIIPAWNNGEEIADRDLFHDERHIFIQFCLFKTKKRFLTKSL